VREALRCELPGRVMIHATLRRSIPRRTAQDFIYIFEDILEGNQYNPIELQIHVHDF
jgi:hypothetical protein